MLNGRLYRNNKKIIMIKTSRITLALIFLLSSLGACKLIYSKSSVEDGFTSLFNGKDIKNWIVKINHHEVGDNFGETFRVKDGVIQVRYDQYGTFNEQFGHLYYEKPFSYFHLKLEYRFVDEWKKDAPSYTVLNSGVMFHSQDPHTMLKDQNWPISIEMQFLGGLGDGKPRPTGNMCSPGTNIV
jgi:hypothetical protein